MRPGDTITVMADTLSRHGDGVGRCGGIEVHVAGLLPGETADVNVDYVSRQRPRAHGSVSHYRSRHPGRRKPPCPHHPRCSGCAIMDLDLAHQRTLKREMVETLQNIPLDRLEGLDDDGKGYRWSSKRVFARRGDAMILGSYVRGTHKVADMSGCLVDHPDIVRCADELVRVASQLKLEPYNDTDHTGDVRYAWFKTDGAGQVMLAVITADPLSDAVERLANHLEVPAGIAWGVNGSRGNDMRGVTLRPIRGRQSLAVDMGGTCAHIGPLGFLQPNPKTASLAYHDLIRLPAGGIPHGQIAFDLYAGAGVTTSMLRRHFPVVVPCESYPESARALGVPPQLVETFLAPITADAHHPHRHVDLVVANPPRGGMGPAVCQQLNLLRARRLHIMSCNPASLAEDLARLTGTDGAYRFIQGRAFDTLPQTSHIEVVVWLVGRADTAPTPINQDYRLAPTRDGS